MNENSQEIFLVDVFLVRLVLPLLGIGAILWGILPRIGFDVPAGAVTVQGTFIYTALGLAALVVSKILWRGPDGRL